MDQNECDTEFNTCSCNNCAPPFISSNFIGEHGALLPKVTVIDEGDGQGSVYVTVTIDQEQGEQLTLVIGQQKVRLCPPRNV